MTAEFPNVEIDSFEGLLVDYAARRNANLILRGIRAISDYELELQMALMNRRLRPETETVFLMAGEALFVYQFAPGEGSDLAGRQRLRAGADAGGRPVAEEDVSEEGTASKLAMQATLEIAERISTISVSSTMKVAADADKLRREGVDVVDFGAGEPDFPTPDNIKNAAIAALAANFTKYTPAGGTQELRQAICERHKLDFGTNYSVPECMVTVGGKHAIFNLIAGVDQSRRRSRDPRPVLGHLQGRGELRRWPLRVRGNRRARRIRTDGRDAGTASDRPRRSW